MNKSENYFPYAQVPGRIDSLAALKKVENPNQYPFPRSSLKEELIELQSDSPYQSNTTKPYQIGRENSKDLYSSCISLPSSVGLTNNQQEIVIKEFLASIKH